MSAPFENPTATTRWWSKLTKASSFAIAADVNATSLTWACSAGVCPAPSFHVSS